MADPKYTVTQRNTLGETRFLRLVEIEYSKEGDAKPAKWGYVERCTRKGDVDGERVTQSGLLVTWSHGHMQARHPFLQPVDSSQRPRVQTAVNIFATRRKHDGAPEVLLVKQVRACAGEKVTRDRCGSAAGARVLQRVPKPR